MRLLMTAALLLFPALPALAAPVPYALEAEESTVGFETDFGPDLITGVMPVKSADLVIDFDRLQDCTIDVLLDVSGAQASFPFAAQAMKGPRIGKPALAGSVHQTWPFAVIAQAINQPPST